MDTKEHIKYWVDSAEHDLMASKSLYISGKYDWCLFVGHLVLEKLLKSLFVMNNNNRIPPKIHNLTSFCRKTAILPKTRQKIFT